MDDRIDNVIDFIKFLSEHQGQDIRITVNQESHCLKTLGIYKLVDCFKFNTVTFDTSNAIEHHDVYIINRVKWYRWLMKAYRFDHQFDYSWDRSKIFGCFYGRPTAARLGIAGHLHKNHSGQSLIKLCFDTNSEDSRKNFEIQKLYGWNNDLSAVVDMLGNIDQYTSEYRAYDYNTYYYDWSNGLGYLYKHIFVDLVVEANLLGDSFYPTEKLARAILCRKPFIVMAPKNYLRYLQQIGFQTFSDIWDESYDLYGSKNRYDYIIALIDSIAKLTPDELIQLNNKIKGIVEHNYQLLVSRKFNKNVIKYND